MLSLKDNIVQLLILQNFVCRRRNTGQTSPKPTGVGVNAKKNKI